MSQSSWERELIERLLLEALREQRRQRRWNLLFRGLFFLLLLSVLLLSFLRQAPLLPLQEHAAQIRLEGILTADAPLNADRFVGALERIEKGEKVKGLLLRLNSPGGSPTQADRIYRALLRFKEKKGVKVVAVVDEICTSGCYYVAAAADKIYANPTSVVGSIGVLSASFGFVGLLEKLGIERRVYTAGEHKAMLDPFLPVRPEHEEQLRRILEEVHAVFTEAVKRGRGERLKREREGLIFSGMVFSARQGLELGLIDGFADPKEASREVLGTERIVDYTPREELWQRLSRGIGTALFHLFTALSLPSL